MRKKCIGIWGISILLFMSVSILSGCSSGRSSGGKSTGQEEKSDGLLDFVIEVEEGRDVRVLQLTDIEIIDSSQKRTPDRLVGTQATIWQPQEMEKQCFTYIRDAVERAEPDFIIITGDLIYGEFDDSGTSLESLIEFMDSFEIPWSPVFGDLEKESAKGVDWQCEQFENSEFCCFKKGITDGHGNYTVGIKQGGQLVRVFYMLDNGEGFTETQMKWLYDRMSAIEKEQNDQVVKASLCYHRPTIEAQLASEQYKEKRLPYTINENVRGEEGDIGSQHVEISGLPVPVVQGMTFVQLLTRFHVDSVFMGHCHMANTSITYEGIRWTFGLKSSTYTNPRIKELLGGTLIIFDKEEMSVEHLYADKEYEEYLNNMDFY